MTEGTKTGSLAVVAGVIALLAWATSSRNNSYAPQNRDLVGKVLFEKFTDPVAAASLKILRYDTPKEDYVEFEVAQDRKSGIWTIPSHESYPADAAKQMSEAANLFVGLKTLGVASEKRSEQALFGVVEPNKQNADKGGEGVGMLVQMRDEKGDILADLIIGKDNDKKQRFVRVPSTDVIYVAELDTTPLSTDFKQWIESDLLKLSGNDIETLGIRDYQIIPVTQGLALTKNYEADIVLSTATGQWQANRITSFDTEPPTEKLVAANEQLNATKLNEIKNAIDNLRIADVLKKPAGLAADLKGDKSLLSNPESLNSLQRRGFLPNPSQKNVDIVDFLSKSGELVVTLKDGVQYLLRFGGPAGADIVKSDAAAGGDVNTEEDIVSINRYLLVTTRVDETKFPQPALERVPETIEELKAIEALKNQSPAGQADAPKLDMPSGDASAGEVPAVPGEEKPAVPSEEKAEATEDKPVAPESEAPAADKSPAGDTPESQASTQSSNGSKLVSFQDPQAVQGDEKKQEPAPVAAEPTDEEWKERLEAAKEKITKENQRKIDQRNEKLENAKKKVAELNGRFSDWYYVISEDDYKKMRIPLADLIQPKSAAPAGGASGFNPGAGAFPGGFQP